MSRVVGGGCYDKLLLGDCLEFLRDIPDESVDCVITDPPFGIKYQNLQDTYRVKGVLVGDSRPFDYGPFTRECFRVLKSGAAFFSWTGWSTYPYHFRQVQRAHFKMCEPLLVQNGHGGTGNMLGSFHPTVDWILFAHKGSFKFRHARLVKNPTPGLVPRRGVRPLRRWKIRLPVVWVGKEYPMSTIRPRANRTGHPTPKNPVFIKWLILLCTDPGQVVLDPFAGTGSTLVAARELGRHYIGMEIDPQWYRHAKKALMQSLGFEGLR